MKAGWISALASVLLLAAACEGQVGEPGQPMTTAPAAIGAAGDTDAPPNVPPVIPGGFGAIPDPANPADPSMPADPASVTPPDSTIPSPSTTSPPSTGVMPPTVPPPSAMPTPANVTGTIVPLYTSPSHPSWTAVIAAKMAHPKVPVIAVVNPANGPGSAVNARVLAGISRLFSAGIKVVGYVATGYTRVPEAMVRADIDRWKAWYPMLSGIFFDEQARTAGQEDYYRRLSQYAKSLGLSFTIGNPGTDSAPSYVGVLDTVLIYESGGLANMSKLAGWHVNHDRSNFGIIPYGTALDVAYVRAAKGFVGYIYLTNDTLPNPWDSVPPYFADLLAALE
jgi:hypothetical protein